MNRNLLLTVTSLLAALLLSFHLAEDVVRGFEPGGECIKPFGACYKKTGRCRAARCTPSTSGTDA